MNLDDALSLVKDHAERHSKSFAAFFRPGAYGLTEQDFTFEHVLTGAVIYGAIGVTLQDSFISGVSVKEISWLDRALGQIVFWITITFLIVLLNRLFNSACRTGSLLTTLRVMPIAFLCGAYAASLGFFIRQLLRFSPATDIGTLPHLLNIIAQLSIIALFMPRELRAFCKQGLWTSRFTTAVVFLFVLMVDLVVVYGHWFMRAGTA